MGSGPQQSWVCPAVLLFAKRGVVGNSRVIRTGSKGRGSRGCLRWVFAQSFPCASTGSCRGCWRERVARGEKRGGPHETWELDPESTRLKPSHQIISYA